MVSQVTASVRDPGCIELLRHEDQNPVVQPVQLLHGLPLPLVVNCNIIIFDKLHMQKNIY